MPARRSWPPRRAGLPRAKAALVAGSRAAAGLGDGRAAVGDALYVGDVQPPGRARTPRGPRAGGEHQLVVQLERKVVRHQQPRPAPGPALLRRSPPGAAPAARALFDRQVDKSRRPLLGLALQRRAGAQMRRQAAAPRPRREALALAKRAHRAIRGRAVPSRGDEPARRLPRGGLRRRALRQRRPPPHDEQSGRPAHHRAARGHGRRRRSREAQGQGALHHLGRPRASRRRPRRASQGHDKTLRVRPRPHAAPAVPRHGDV
mmetsp:Transcript_1586/g.5716  ORF Transcript_1586/g.5716 Transcript_1586/m.5716 type:complete len:261 (+) Transcript_1586:652-1434(+)